MKEKELYIIVNEGARTGKAAVVWKKVKEILNTREIPYKAYRTEYKGHATHLAYKISSLPEKTLYLLVLGGDGTINEVLNGITDFEKVRLGVIPTGSGNDFGRGIGLPQSPEEILECILTCISQEQEGKAVPRIDLGQVSWSGCEKPRLFGISAGVGLDAIVCKKALHTGLKTILNKIHLGKLTYILLTIETLFSMDTTEMSIHTETVSYEQSKMIFAAAMNLRAEGGGVPMAPKASPTDGKLSVCSVCGIPKWRTFFCLPFLMAAKHEKIKGFQIMDSEKIQLHVGKPMVLHADGEYLGEVTDVEFLCLKNKLQLLYKGE